ncbi:CrcB family protein [Microbacterium sp. NPDC089189]|uniref:fluoride efflux transporter FluC n=1 Tax=Microbacterium sp. NPDC089189 TaxID=3154972 RepID=UPI0034392B57
MTPAPIRPTAAQLGLVVLGGAIGTAARAGLLLIDAPGWTTVAVPVINVVGAFLLGLLTGVLSRRAPSPRAGAARQLIGTGVLGGFTTYSTFAVQAVDGATLVVTVATALLGVAAAVGGLSLGGWRRAA